MHGRTLLLLPVVLGTTLVVGVVAQQGLCQTGEPARESPARIRGLLAALEDPDDEVVAEALERLRDSKQRTHPEVEQRLREFIRSPRMEHLLHEASGHVRSVAISALSTWGGLGKEHAPWLVTLLEDPQREVRFAAAEALGLMGEEAREQLPRLMALLESPEPATLWAAAHALGSMGEAAQEQLPHLVTLLKRSEPRLRGAVAYVLGCMGEAARAHLPLLSSLLEDPDPRVRRGAVRGLGGMGAAAEVLLPRIVALLEDPDLEVRLAAVEALGSMGETARHLLPRLVRLLEEPNPRVRAAATLALARMGESAREQLPPIAALLGHPEGAVRVAAVETLAGLGKTAQAYVPQLVARLEDPDPRVREAAALALGLMAEAAWNHLPQLFRLLEHPDAGIRAAAARALGCVGEAEWGAIPRLVSFLRDEGQLEPARAGVADALLDMAPLDFHLIATLLAEAEQGTPQRAAWLIRAYGAGGGEPKVGHILRWLNRSAEELPRQLSLGEARGILEAFAEFWPATAEYPELRDDLARRLVEVVGLVEEAWEPGDHALLALHERNLRESHPQQADRLHQIGMPIDSQAKLRHRLRLFVGGWALHAAFWLLFLFAYPRSRYVQAFIFWNPKVRKLLGLGYVHLLLTHVPFLRRCLLAPFRSRLLADADLESFSVETYFTRAEVLTPPGGRECLLDALPLLDGHVILEGASGLGKSMFIRYLLRSSARLAVYLPAERCKGGVLEAIQSRLEGKAKDTRFLQSILHGGALDIYIDGLNEVTADTRARIVHFVERNANANILLATQRIEWTPPAGSRTYVLQPICEVRLLEFLFSRRPLLENEALLQAPDYDEACARFVQEALSPELPAELLQATREVLSNPMDLTVVAQMLAAGHMPNLFHLRQQQYALMARDYLSIHLAPFPLGEFAEEAYLMRLEERAGIPEDAYARELLRLEAARLVVRRQWSSPGGEECREWRFRHDKIQEFFIAQTFLGEHNERIFQHMEDPRFRGVYFLLALLLAPEEARRLRELLVERAARTHDHTVSDDFVNLFKTRQELEKVCASLEEGTLPDSYTPC